MEEEQSRLWKELPKVTSDGHECSSYNVVDQKIKKKENYFPYQHVMEDLTS